LQTSNVLLGYTLLIASIAQSRSPGLGLSVYHAVVVLNLNLVIALGGWPLLAAAVGLSANLLRSNRDSSFLHSLIIRSTLYVGHLIFTSAFGIWLYTTINQFDTTGSDCTSSTVYYAFGKRVYVDDYIFRRSWIAFYSILAIPFVNFLFVCLLVFLATALAVSLATFALILLLLVLTLAAGIALSPFVVFNLILNIFNNSFIRHPTFAFKWSALNHARAKLIWGGFVFFTPVFWMVWLTEGTIAVNNVGIGEGVWTFGQMAALIIAIPPTGKVVKETYLMLKDFHFSPVRYFQTLVRL
jgi:hypothetical protein